METLAPDSKIWIYQADRSLNDVEINRLEHELAGFCSRWTAHNHQLKAHYNILYQRFIVLMVDETHTDASGCSIDKSVAFLKMVSEQFQISLFDRMYMAYLKNNTVHTLHLSEVETALNNGLIDGNTLFFNTTIQRLAELENNFLVPLETHWLYERLSPKS